MSLYESLARLFAAIDRRKAEQLRQCQMALDGCQQGALRLKNELDQVQAQLQTEQAQLAQWEPSFEVSPVKRSTPWMEVQMASIPNYQRGMTWLRLDSTFYLCEYEDMNRIWGWDWVNTRQYLAEKFDCDDFAFLFKANCTLNFGINSVALVIDYSAAHAYNLIFFPDQSAIVFEPQSDFSWDIDKRPKETYKMERGVILI